MTSRSRSRGARVLLAAALIACAPPAEARPRTRPELFKYAEEVQANALHPLGAENGPAKRLMPLMYDPLITENRYGKSIPGLAGKWWVAEDDRSIRVQLRTDVTWHDGRPVRAADVVYTVTKSSTPGITGARPVEGNPLHVILDVAPARRNPESLLDFPIFPESSASSGPRTCLASSGRPPSACTPTAP